MSHAPAGSPQHSPSAAASSSPPPPPLALFDPAHVAALQARNNQMNAEGLALQKQLAEVTALLAAEKAKGKGPRVKAPLPTPFTGMASNLGGSVDAYLDDLQLQFDYYGPSEFPTDATKIRLATSYLAKTARTWWTNLPDSDLITTWDAFVNALHHRFRPALPAEVARRRLKDLKQRGNVNSYASLFQQILEYIPDKSDADQVFDFRSGLDKNIAIEVAKKEPKTLHEAIDIAINAEIYVTRGSGYGNPHDNRGSAPPSSASQGISTPMELSAASQRGRRPSRKYSRPRPTS